MQLSPVPPRRQDTIVIPSDRPVFRIAEGAFFGPDDQLYPEGSIISWHDEPNQTMVPLNELAQEAMKEYLTKLDKAGAEVAAKIGRSYQSLADAYENSMVMAKEESKGLQLLNAPEQKPLMGAKKKGIAEKISKVEAEQDIPLTGSNGRYSVKKEHDA